MTTRHLDAGAKAELNFEAKKLIDCYESPFETVKALMVYNCELETQILALAQRYPQLVAVSFDPTPPVLG